MTRSSVPYLRSLTCLMMCLGVLGSCGCSSNIPAATAHEAASRHNEWVESIQELWVWAHYTSRSTVEGTRQVETGDADLVLAPGVEGAYLRFGKLNVSFVEITSQPDYCWTIVHPDAHPDGKRGVVEIIRRENFGSPCAQQSLAPALPGELLILAGLVKIPQHAEVTRSSKHGGALEYRFQLPQRKGSVGLVLDVNAGVPIAVAISLPPAEGKPWTVTSQLTQFETWNLGATNPNLPMKILILAGDEGDSLEIDVDNVKPRSRRRDSATLGLFDPEDMLRRYEQYDLHVLDAGCPNPTVINNDD